MKKLLFGIFAHPDDEAFGPSGTLYKLAQNNVDVHLILITSGDAGKNDFGYEDLRDVRLKEWQASGALIGASSMYHLGYNDGEICNKHYLEIAEKIIDSIQATLEAYSEPISIDIITFEPKGISGHLDHIAASLISTYVYATQKQKNNAKVTFNKLKYFCISDRQVPTSNTNWLYMPPGYKDSEVDEIVDITDVLDQKLVIMKAHESQKDDMESILERQNATNCRHLEHFLHYKD